MKFRLLTRNNAWFFHVLKEIVIFVERDTELGENCHLCKETPEKIFFGASRTHFPYAVVEKIGKLLPRLISFFL